MKSKKYPKKETIYFKFVVLGDDMVGKTALINRYISNIFKDIYFPTIGMDIRIKRLEINNNDINISIIDTA